MLPPAFNAGFGKAFFAENEPLTQPLVVLNKTVP